jgi:tRNA(Ile)-lysidine synthase TilS/MesJ
MKDKKICKKCILPEAKPGIWLNDEGVCNICITHEKEKNFLGGEKGALETDFIKILEKNKGKGEYDCLVMCSGGKDSTSALYYIKERYKLNPLAFTFDHGFETSDALENVHKAVDKLGVDFLFFKSSFMKDMFAKILKTGSRAVICHLCSIWYMDLTYKIAAKYNIPIIIAGWTKGQSVKQPVMSKCACKSDAPEYASMAQATKDFIEEHVKNDPKYKNFPKSMEEVLKKAKKRHKSMVVSPHWFLPIDADTYVETIKKELDWKYPKLSYPAKTTNCELNFISVYNSKKHYGYTHYDLEMSRLIREGIVSREEALRDLEINFDKDLLNVIAKKLGYKFE